MADQGKAIYTINQAVKRGEVERPEICELCGASGNIVAHHHAGYDQPLNVWWVCRSCNGFLGKNHNGEFTKDEASQKVEEARDLPAHRRDSAGIFGWSFRRRSKDGKYGRN